MIILNKEQVIAIHSILINQSGGIDGVRDRNLLDSALKAPFQTFSGEDLYPTIPQKAACLCFGLINNHSFLDGNKRIGILVMMTFMELNHMPITCTDEELIQLGLGVASNSIGQNEVLSWIIDRMDK